MDGVDGDEIGLRLSSPACAYSAPDSLIMARRRGLVCVVFLEVWWCGCEASFNNSNHSVPFHAPELTSFCYVLKKLIRLVLCPRNFLHCRTQTEITLIWSPSTLFVLFLWWALGSSSLAGALHSLFPDHVTMHQHFRRHIKDLGIKTSANRPDRFSVVFYVITTTDASRWR